jgi:hypothetical protein
MKISPESKKDFNFINNFTESYYANIGIYNKNISNYRLPKRIENILDDFSNFKAFDIYYGDNKGYSYRAVISPFLNKFKDFYNNLILHEYNSIKKIMKIYNKDKILRLDLLNDYTKFSLFNVKEEIFWAFLKYLRIIYDEDIKIPLKPSGIAFEVYKKKIDFDLADFVKNNSHFIKTIDKYEEEIKLDNDIFARINSDSLNDSTEDEKKTNKGKINISTINDREILNSLRKNFFNKDMFSIKLYHNENIIFDLSINDFEKKIGNVLLTNDEIKDFCKPNKYKIWFYIFLIVTFLIFIELIMIVYFYLTKLYWNYRD